MPEADARPRFVKIVRDRIALFLGTSEVIYEQATREQIVAGLRKKLIEEAGEYLVNPSLDELADVYEVVTALAQHDLGLSLLDVSHEANVKYNERGGFDDGMAMFVYTTAPARHEGEHTR